MMPRLKTRPYGGGARTGGSQPHPVYHRRSIRLRGYDYSQAGGYFFTIVARRRKPLFGAVKNGVMPKNRFGEIVQACWQELPVHYSRVQLGAFIVMPDHAHGVIFLSDSDEVGTGSVKAVKGDSVKVGSVTAGFKPARTIDAAPTESAPTSLSEIIRALKTFSARQINEFRHLQGNPVWQRNYYERVIRNERELSAIRRYIISNPTNWDSDKSDDEGVFITSLEPEAGKNANR